MQKTLPQGTQIWFSLDAGEQLSGTVVGVATTGAVFLGLGYIVELHDPYPGYAYTHGVVFDSMIDRSLTPEEIESLIR